MSDDKANFDEERTKAMLAIGQRHIEILQQLFKTHQGIDLQIEVIAEFARFSIEFQNFRSQKFLFNGGIVPGKSETITVNTNRSIPQGFRRNIRPFESQKKKR